MFYVKLCCIDQTRARRSVEFAKIARGREGGVISRGLSEYFNHPLANSDNGKQCEIRGICLFVLEQCRLSH